MVLQIDNAVCVLGTASDRDGLEESYYKLFIFLETSISLQLFFKKKVNLSTGIVAGMSNLLAVFLLLVYWESGWYGVR